MKASIKVWLSAVTLVLLTVPAYAKTLLLEGSLSSKIRLTQQITFAVSQSKDTFTYRYALPAQGSSRSTNQKIEKLKAEYQPEPAQVKDSTDRFGNKFRTVTWKNLDRDARVKLTYEATILSELKAMESMAPFPLSDIPAGEKVYLQPADQVQSTNREIVALAKKLTAGASSEYEAVTAIMRHVANSVAYAYNPPKYDALYSLETGSGNCQNFAHLALALLRASGIPGRVVGGYTLKDSWKIPVGSGSSLVQSMGQGGHAWLEIYFPDLGWLSYDPQQSMQFTSTRHIKQTHGLQVKDIVDTWRAVAPVPQYSETTDAAFLDDQVNLHLAGQMDEPHGYLASNRIKVKLAAAKPVPEPLPAKPMPPSKPVPDIPPPPVPQMPEPPPVPVEPPPPVLEPPVPVPPVSIEPPSEPPRIPEPPAKPMPLPGTEVTFGNMIFPSLVDVYETAGDVGTRILDKETAEYVTSRGVYAQAFRVESPLRIGTVSLAMKKFGGDGTVYLDIVADDNGKPGLMNGVRSLPVYLDKLKRQLGYSWVDFPIADDAAPFLPGKYWVVLRRSGEAIMNWFYIPGKRYGDAEDTRSTARGWQWEDILNYDFVFKVSGTAQ